MEKYRYTESGLDTVIIEGAQIVSDDTGERCATIPNVNGLHRAIANAIVCRHGSMTGQELRFLRTEIGMTQAELAAMLHREPLTVSRWERNENPIDSNAETVIRLFAAQRLELDASMDVQDTAGWCVSTAGTPPIVIDGSDPEHYRQLDVAA